MDKLNIGDKAPEFEGLDQHGNLIILKNFSGSKVILYFYPKDNTPGCTQEACNLRDNESLLLKKGFKIVGISADNQASHLKFSEKYQLQFPLIADTEKEIIKKYDVWGKKKFMGKEYEGVLRTTFVIAEDGRIERIFYKVKTKEHAEQILKEYN